MLVTALLDNQSALRYQILNILLEQSQPISCLLYTSDAADDYS